MVRATTVGLRVYCREGQGQRVGNTVVRATTDRLRVYCRGVRGGRGQRVD